MLILKPISKEDRNYEFITGNKAFNVLNPDGTLNPYLEQDIISGGEFITYLLFEKKNDNYFELLGIQ